MIKATIFSFVVMGLFSTTSFAERNLDNMWKEQYRQHKEQQRCLKSPEYCEEKAKLHQLQIDRLVLTKHYNVLKNAAKKECRKLVIAQRMGFDPIGNRYPVQKACSEYSSYREAQALTAKAPALKAQIEVLTDRINEQNALVAELAAKLED